MRIAKTIKRAGFLLALLAFTAMPGFAYLASQDLPLPTIRGQLSAKRTAMLSSSLSGTLIDIPYRAGDSFKKGDLLYQLNCSVYENERRKAQADLALAEKTLKAMRQLESMQSVSELEIAQAESTFQSAKAQHAISQVIIEKCHFKAPYDGRVSERIARPLEYVNIGDELLSIIDNQSLEIEVLIPSTLLSRFSEGTPIYFTTAETGMVVKAIVSALGAYIDPASRTIRIRATLDGTYSGLLSGMTGTITLAGATLSADPDITASNAAPAGQ